MVEPRVFFDPMGPVTFVLGEGVNVRRHPHVNLVTVTYLFEGDILHRNSLGYVKPIARSDINLMVAGSLRLEGAVIPKRHLAVVDAQKADHLKAVEDAHVAFIAGLIKS